MVKKSDKIIAWVLVVASLLLFTTYIMAQAYRVFSKPLAYPVYEIYEYCPDNPLGAEVICLDILQCASCETLGGIQTIPPSPDWDERTWDSLE